MECSQALPPSPMPPGTDSWSINQRIESIPLALAQTRLEEAQYDYKIAEVTLAYSAGGRNQLDVDSTLH